MIYRLQSSILVKKGGVIIALESRHGDSHGRSIQQRQRRLQSIVPRNECNFVERIDDRPFELCHHLHIVDVLDVVALHDRNPSVYNHILGVERPKHGLVKVDHLDVDIG